jgi:hypothetical protein
MAWHRIGGRLALDRRTLLRGLLGGTAVSFALPPLEAMFNSTGTAYALDGVLPKRFGVWFWGNGNRPEHWRPSSEGVGDAWSLSTTLTPLADVKKWLTVVTGTDILLPNDAPHGSGAAGVLSGGGLIDVLDEASLVLPTIDQVMASYLGNETLFRSIETGCSGAKGKSYNGPNSRNPPESSAVALFDRLFGPTFREPGDSTVDPRLGLRRSVLDAVFGEITTLQGQVSATDRTRLEQHMDGLRDLENRLARLEEDPPDLEACVRPGQPVDLSDIDGRPQLREQNQIMAELLAMSMACDQTRVFSHWFCDPVNDLLFPEASAGHHDLTHNEGGEQPQVQSNTVFCMEAFGDFVRALAAIPEGSGTLLDNCAVMACSEVSLGQTHSIADMPILIAGSACGRLKTDYHYRSLGGESTSKVLLALLQAMDVPLTEFGTDEGYVDVPLSGLFA